MVSGESQGNSGLSKLAGIAAYVAENSANAADGSATEEASLFMLNDNSDVGAHTRAPKQAILNIQCCSAPWCIGLAS